MGSSAEGGNGRIVYYEAGNMISAENR